MIALQAIFCGLVAVGLVAALAAHLSTFAGVDPQAEFGALPALGLGAVAATVLAVVIALRESARGSMREPTAAPPPLWATAVWLLIGIYGVVCLVAWMEPEGRQVSVVRRTDGTAHLATVGGQYLREIGDEGIRRRGVLKARAVSGLLAGFYLGMAACIVAARPGHREAAAGPDAQPSAATDPTGM